MFQGFKVLVTVSISLFLLSIRGEGSEGIEEGRLPKAEEESSLASNTPWEESQSTQQSVPSQGQSFPVPSQSSCLSEEGNAGITDEDLSHLADQLLLELDQEDVPHHPTEKKPLTLPQQTAEGTKNTSDEPLTRDEQVCDSSAL